MARSDDDVSISRALLRPCLLLLLAERPSHGYDLSIRLRALGVDAGGAGPLYQALRRLEGIGLVVSAWDASETGPARRNYRLTPAGWESLRSSTEGLVRLGQIVGVLTTRIEEATAAADARRDEAPGA